MIVHARPHARSGFALLALVLVLLVSACMDAVEPTPGRAPWNVLDADVTIDRASVRPTLDTAAIGYLFVNVSSNAVSLSDDDGCPRWAAGALYGNAIFLLTPVCGVDGYTADSVTQRWSVPGNDSTTVEVPFTGTASIGRTTPCALVGAPTLVALSVDGRDIAVVPLFPGTSVPASTSIAVTASETVPPCEET